MSKLVHGFPRDTDRDEAIQTALQHARDSGMQGELRAEIVDTDAHRANGEYAVVVRAGGTAIG